MISAGLAVERIPKDVTVADTDHLPDRSPGAEEVALAAPDAFLSARIWRSY
jgi:hypothetical protein